MKRWLALVTVALVLAFVWIGRVQADAPFRSLLPGTRADYRFDYRGDGSQIQIALDASDATNITLGIYTPDQVEALKRGEMVTPVGRGMPSRDHDLFWAGAFRVPGVYHAIVENRSNVSLLYRLDITGEGVSGAAQVVAQTAPSASTTTDDKGQRFLVVTVPPGLGISALRLPMPAAPPACTHVKEIPATIAKTIKLCPNEIYPPLRVVGNNIGIYTDDARTAIVTSTGRQFAITVEGANNWVEGVMIQARADPQDATAWLCQYDECIFPTQPTTTTLRGGIQYGGGILLKGTNSTVHGVTVRGGTIGVATTDGRNNYILDNQLSDLGWGAFSVNSVSSYFLGNTFDRDNRACTTPDGRKFLHGCETSGWVCLNCQQNVIANNHCERSANCFYMSGERGLASNDNKLVANYCAGASDNCFELTFSQRNLLQDNISTVDYKTDTPCKYPFWVGGSIVFFQNNRWECAINSDDAFNQSRDSTIVATNIINLDVPGVPAMIPGTITVTPAPPRLGRASGSIGAEKK